jgi:hypothetical protein
MTQGWSGSPPVISSPRLLQGYDGNTEGMCVHRGSVYASDLKECWPNSTPFLFFFVFMRLW